MTEAPRDEKPNKGGANPAPPHRIVKHSVRLAGHRTSVALERAFWDELDTIAASRGLSRNALIAHIDETRSGALASALRLFVLACVKA